MTGFTETELRALSQQKISEPSLTSCTVSEGLSWCGFTGRGDSLELGEADNTLQAFHEPKQWLRHPSIRLCTV